MTNKKVIFLLRVGIAFSFLYAAISGFIDPSSWIGFIPQFVTNVLPVETALIIFGVVEILLALALLLMKNLFYPAILSALIVFGIIISNIPQRDILFRDVPIILMALALAVHYNDRGMGMKTILTWVVILVVVVGGIFLLVSNDTKNNVEEDVVDTTMPVPAPGNEDVEEMIVNDSGNVVTYTKGGFSPKEITVKKGETVTFINESSGDMWVASAIHPTHSLYPKKRRSDCLGSSFDQCKAVEAETSWSFTFDVEGKHGYHNHVRSSDSGKVIVK